MPVRKILFMIVGWMAFSQVSAQEVPIPELLSFLDIPHYQVDTILKKRSFTLMRKDVGFNTSIYSYSSLEQNKDAPTIIRSVTYAEVHTNDLESRLITYRTYSKEEYRQEMAYLLQHDYKTTHQFDFGDAHHTLFSNGQHVIRVIVSPVKLNDGQVVTAYEFRIEK